MPTGKPERKEGESSGDDTKKRTASPSLDDDGSDSTDSRRSRRKKPRVCSLIISCLIVLLDLKSYLRAKP